MNQKDFVYFDCSQQYISNKRQRIPKGNKKNGQPRETENKTKKNKTKTQHNMCWEPLYTNKHKQRK